MIDRNRLYRADCKIVADELIREGVKVDLIYLDPPFNSNRTYSMIFNHGGVTAQQKAYHDMWDFTDSTRQLVLDFSDELDTWDLPESFKEFMRSWLVILEGGTAADRKLLNYLMYMTQRLVRFRDFLSPTGSVYFHCDPTASHYVKVILDGVFSRRNFRSEVIWKRTSSHNRAKRWVPIHDVILFYARDGFTWNRVLQPLDPEYVDRFYRHRDERGRYRLGDLKGPGERTGESGRRWRGVDPSPRHWEPPPDRALPDWFVFPEGYADLSVHERLDILDRQGLIYWPPRGTVPQFKRYLTSRAGRPVADVVTDIPPISAQARERLGYQTQKPLDLLSRIVEVSTGRDAVVFDPFGGCGTTIEAAQRLGRRWIGVDISGDAVDAIRQRLEEMGIYAPEHYDVHEGSPDTMAEYQRLNPYEKQEWLIRRCGGLPNPRKSGDRGVDGDMTFHLGTGKDDADIWGRLVFSVKTGKQRSPAHVRELRGTMRAERAQMGVLILDGDPTPGMEKAAAAAGSFTYQPILNLPPKEYDKVQIVTAYEVIDGARADHPPTMQDVKRYRQAQGRLRI
ncbi:MAG: DNA methyltransferase [bacterium]|nr:DNA methyltransferase [bacterium]MDE0289531.1 DNA methyltransferase [bacterium]MDE0438855.1 DNA methyltransferase [bacterium]